MSTLRRQALDLVKANEHGHARICAVRQVMLAEESMLQFIIDAYEA